MKTLYEDYDIPYSHTVMPIGIRNADIWYRGIAKAVGKEQEVEEIIAREHERIEPHVAELMSRLQGKRVFICGGTGRSFAAAALINDFGMELVGLETPTNPMMNVTDISAAAEIAKRHGLLLIVDNTFLSPYFQNPLDHGADVVVHSGTKFLGGHNDTLAGFLVTKRADLAEKFAFLIKTVGSGLAPFDSWLILRGIKTLGLRMERAQENARKIAEWLGSQSIVTRVIYPGLPEHPGHKIMKKQARGFGSMLTFHTTTKAATLSILEKVRMIKYVTMIDTEGTYLVWLNFRKTGLSPEELDRRIIYEAKLWLDSGKIFGKCGEGF